MSRVVSKNLFNYQLNGVKPDEIIAMEDQMKAGLENNSELKALKELVDSDDPAVDPEVAAKLVRLSMQGFTDMLDAQYKDYVEKCTHTEFKVPLRDGNDYEVPVYVHTPIELMSEKANAAFIYAHGGGVVGGDALQFKPGLSAMAVTSGIVVFNVDYRLAPETKFPKNALDFYCAVKHVIENAENLGIDPARIAIAGDSGGGYICFATMVMLAQKDEGDLIKLAIAGVPMIDDYCFTDPASMTQEERESAPGMRKIWRCIANDIDAERTDPVLFPAKASDELLAKMPPTIIWEFEFDIYITEATRMAHRMRRAGRLLEFRVQPGMNHSSAYFPSNTPWYKNNSSDHGLVIKEYLLR